MSVLVTGATGNVGVHVIRALQRRSVPARAFVRDATRATARLGEDVELAPGDFEDTASIRAALDGVDRVFLSSADGPRKVEHEAAVVDACAHGGIELVVKASTLFADAASPLAPFAWNGRSEEHLRRSGVPAVVLRSAFYMTNVLGAIDGDRLLAPAARGRVAMIDPADVGAVAAAVLSADDHAGRTYRITGPEAIGFAEAAAALTVDYVDVPAPRRARSARRRRHARLARRAPRRRVRDDPRRRLRGGHRHRARTRRPRAADHHRVRARAPAPLGRTGDQRVTMNRRVRR